jgi:hypothetical protein
MRRMTLVMGLVFVAAARSSPAFAEPPAPSASAFPGPTPALPPIGVAVLGLAGATDVAWPLAQSVYATPSLRPASMDEPHARVLCGEALPGNPAPELRDLAEIVAALRHDSMPTDDAPGLALLADVARRLSVRAIVVVRTDAGRPSARVFLADSGAFDAALYGPDPAAPSSWSMTTRSLVRAFGSDHRAPRVEGVAPGAATHAPPLATHGGSDSVSPTRGHAFYESGWFWGAIGAAAFAGGAVFLATRDSGPSAIHLQLQVPH